jgi:uridine kinase
VVSRRYAEALPILTALEARLISDGRATLALDGDCASGKTTLAQWLAPLYDCNVFHMDDFFLPFELRTAGRLAEPGGNVHYERFREQVLAGLLSGAPFTYGAFDCHTGLTREVRVSPRPVALIEGSYALHPAFDAAYGRLAAVRARLTVDAEEQLRRIRRRNGEAMLRRFQNEWIPLEIRYFEAYHKTRADQLTLPSLPDDEDEPAGEDERT